MRRIDTVLAVTVLLVAGARADKPSVRPSWDPPAINVFPDHGLAARSADGAARMVVAGEALFRARFNAADGGARPAATGDSKPTPRAPVAIEFSRTSGPDAGSCFACHNQPDVGGSGDFVANVFVGAHFASQPITSIATEDTSERNTISMFGSGAIEMLAREMTTELRSLRDRALETVQRTGRPLRVELQTKGVRFGALTIRADATIDATRL